MVSVQARRAAAAFVMERGLSQRRACTLLNVARSALNYVSLLAVKDAPVLGRMCALSGQYPRYGYRRIAIFLRRDGHAMSFGRAYRLWQDARLQVPKKRSRKRVASGRPRPKAPEFANQVWSYDFVFDACANGQTLKCLTVTDEWTKECLAIEVDGRIRSHRVIEVLARLVSERGAPKFLRSDNVLRKQGNEGLGQRASVPHVSDAGSFVNYRPVSVYCRRAHSHSKHRIHARSCALVLTVLNTRCRSGRKTRTLSTRSKAAPLSQRLFRERFVRPAPALPGSAGSLFRI
jgi:hypothetical protein